jgi:hypothetical protein
MVLNIIIKEKALKFCELIEEKKSMSIENLKMEIIAEINNEKDKVEKYNETNKINIIKNKIIEKNIKISKINEIYQNDKNINDININDKNELIFKIIFFYDDYNYSDIINSFNENEYFIDHLNVMVLNNFKKSFPLMDLSSLLEMRMQKKIII